MSNDAKTAGALTGALAGAGTGATVGSAFSPAGTGIGAIVGAVAGAFGGAKTKEAEQEARDKEVQRIEQREDTAVQRHVADSLQAGIDPRQNSSDPASAGSQSVAPMQFESVADNLTASASPLASALAGRLKLETETANTLHASWRSFVDDGYKSLADTEKQLNTLLADERATLELSAENQRSADTAYNTSYESAFRALTEKSFSKEEYDKVSTYVSELSADDEKKRSRALTELENIFQTCGQLSVNAGLTGLGGSASARVDNTDKSKDASEQTEEQGKQKQREDREDTDASTKKTYRFDKQSSETIANKIALSRRDSELAKYSSVYRSLDWVTKQKYASAYERVNAKMRLDYRRANTPFDEYVSRTFKHSRNFFRFLRDPFGHGSDDYLKQFNY